MDGSTQISSKLDLLVQGFIRLEAKVENYESRMRKVEEAISAEKTRLDKKFETDVRPIRARYDGFSFLLKTLGVLALVSSVVGGFIAIWLKVSDAVKPAPSPPTSPSAQGKDHEMPPLRPTRRRE